MLAANDIRYRRLADVHGASWRHYMATVPGRGYRFVPTADEASTSTP